VTAYQHVYALKPSKLVEQFAPTLRNIKDLMLAKTPDSAAAAQTALTELDKAIEAALKEELKAQLAAFKQDVNRQIVAAHEAKTKDRLQNEILFGIDVANDLVGSNLPAANQKLKDLRVEYARIMAEDLKANLDDIPFGFNQDTWSPEQRTISAKIDGVLGEQDGERAIAAYNDAYGLYLTRLVEGLLRSLSQDLLSIPGMENNQQLTPELATTLRKSIDDLSKVLKGTLAKIKDGDLNTSRNDYMAAKESYLKEVQPAFRAPARLRDEDNAPVIGSVLAAGGSIPAQVSDKPVAHQPERQIRNMQQISRTLTVGGVIVTIVAVLVATGSGLILLWVNRLSGAFGEVGRSAPLKGESTTTDLVDLAP
jgi:hypothetical protein